MYSISICIILKNRNELGRDLFVNIYRLGQNETQYYSLPGTDTVDYGTGIDLVAENDRCVAVTSSGSRLAHCEDETLGALCWRNQGTCEFI